MQVGVLCQNPGTSCSTVPKLVHVAIVCQILVQVTVLCQNPGTSYSTVPELWCKLQYCVKLQETVALLYKTSCTVFTTAKNLCASGLKNQWLYWTTLQHAAWTKIWNYLLLFHSSVAKFHKSSSTIFSIMYIDIAVLSLNCKYMYLIAMLPQYEWLCLPDCWCTVWHSSDTIWLIGG